MFGYIYGKICIFMKDKSSSGLETSNDSFSTKEETSRDLATMYELTQQKYIENLRTTEDLLRRITILEEMSPKSNECF